MFELTHVLPKLVALRRKCMKGSCCIHVADIATALDFCMYTFLHLGGKGSKLPESAGNVVYVCAAVVPFIKYCSAQNGGGDFCAAWSGY